MFNINRKAPLRPRDEASGGGGLTWFPKNGLDKDIYVEAANDGMTVSMYLEKMRSKRLEKKSDYDGMTYPEVFAYKHALIAKGEVPPLTAIEECFKYADIKISGQFTDPVGKIYQFSDLDVIFPEYISNKIYAGLLKESLVPKLVAETSVVDSIDFHKIYIEDTEAQRQTGKISIGGEMATTKISVGKRSIYLQKYGRYLEVAYEEIDKVRFNMFGRILERVGQQIQIDETDDMINVLINGDGNTDSTPGTTVESDATGTVATADVIEWVTCLPTPYRMTDMIGKKALLVEYYSVFFGLSAPSDQIGVTKLVFPEVHEWDRTIVTSDYFIGIDKRYAVEHITSGNVLTESEKIIKRQINGTAVSIRDAFSIIDNDAVAIFDETHT